MNVLIAMFAGLAGGTITAFVAAALTAWICQLLGVSGREGAIGYLAAFVGILAGLAGMIVTIILTLRWRGQSGVASLVQAPIALGGIVALGALGVWIYYNAHDHPVVNGAPPLLDFELQAPPNADLPDAKNVQIRLQAGEKGRADGWWDDLQTQQVDGRRVLTGHMQLYLKTANRLVVLRFPGGVDHLFQLRLPASPLGKKYQQWSAWQTSDFLFTPESKTGQRVPPERAYKIRYSVESLER